MDKETSDIQNILSKISTVSSSKTDIGGTCKPKKEDNFPPSKAVVSEKGDETRETKAIPTQLKHKEKEKVNVSDTQILKKMTEASSCLKKKTDKIPVLEKNLSQEPVNVILPKIQSLPATVFGNRPLVLAVHLVPSLPITLFEILAEAIEAATGKPVVLLHESRIERPVAKEVTDIAILPAVGNWNDGVLLPASFVFEHRMNKNFLPHIYGDVVVATDRAPHVKTLMDLRGSKCVLADWHNSVGTSALLFNYLKSKGEGPSFFGSNLNVDSQLAALHMITGKQVEVGILESPVIKYHRNSLPGAETLLTLFSLGPLPPYRIMVHKDMPASLVHKITTYLLKVNQDSEWMEKFSPFHVLGFAENTKSYYELEDIKSVVTSSPYY